MSRPISIILNGRELQVEEGTTVAAALLNEGVQEFRRSSAGQARAPVCGMGVCFECRATIDGQPYQRTCMVLCRDGMEVKTDG